MVADKPRILIADDQSDVREALRLLLKSEGFAADLVDSPAAVVKAVQEKSYAALLFDLNYTRDTTSGREGMDALPQILAADRNLPIIVMTAWGSIDLAVDAMRRGARDFIEKPWDNDRLVATVRTQIEFRDVLRTPLPAAPAAATSITESAVLRADEMKRLKEESTALRVELQGAANYIRAMLPEPVTEPVQVDWRFLPFSAVGGDAFGYHWIDEDHFALYILDVCGHGVPAALLSASALKVLRAHALPTVDFRDPGMVLSALNNAFLMRDQNNLYFTIWYGVWQRRTRELRYSCAGHPPAVLLTSSGTRCAEPIGVPGLVLGARAGKRYETHSRTLDAGSALYLLTDGIYEVRQPDGNMWQFEDFMECVKNFDVPGGTPLDRLLEHVRGVRGEEPLDDDVSLVRFAL